MDFKKLEVFINLVETKNYTRTARSLNVTQPTVTHDIQAIETEIGVKLFNRNKRQVEVTNKGKQFYQKIKPLINTYYSAVQEVQKDKLQAERKITIGYSYTPFNETYISGVIKKFYQLHPQVTFNAISVNHNQLKQYLENREVDVLFTTIGDAADLHQVGFLPLKKSKFFAIVPKMNLLAKKTSLNLSDFNKQRMIFIDNNWTGTEMIKLQNQILKQNPDVAVTYTNDVAAESLLINALSGIALGLNFIFRDDNSNLVQIPLEDNRILTYGAVYQLSNQNPVLHDFISFLKK